MITLNKRIFFAFVLILLILLGYVILPVLKSPSDDEDIGLIVVDSPEIYTRERLINDRFTQSAWLESVLKKPFKYKGVEVADKTQDIQELNMALIASISDDKTKEHSPSTNGGNQNIPLSKPDVRLSPTDEFRDELEYRHEIRSELMQALLDDRHDLHGNTLYRLSFDTSIIPNKTSDRWAVIHIKLEKDDYLSRLEEYCKEDKNSECSDNEIYEWCARNSECHRSYLLYREWVEDTQRNLNKQIDNRLASFYSQVEDNDRLLDYQTLFVKPTSSTDHSTKSNYIFDFIKASLSLRIFDENCVKGQSENIRGGYISKLENCVKENKSPPVSCEDEYGKKKTQDLLNTLHNEIFEARIYSDRKSCTSQPIKIFNNNPNQIKLLTIYHQIREQFLIKAAAMAEQEQEQAQAQAEISTKTFQETYAKLLRESRQQIAEICGSILSEDCDTRSADPDKKAAMTSTLGKCVIGLDKFQTKIKDFYCKQNEEERSKFEPESNLSMLSTPKNANEYIIALNNLIDIEKRLIRTMIVLAMETKYFTNKKEPISTYLNYEIKGCGIGRCLFKLSDDYSKGFEFLKKLEKFNRVFTYAVSPKEKAQRVSKIEQQQKNNRYLLSLHATSPKVINNAEAALLTKLTQNSTRQLNHIQRRPKVIGFSSSNQESDTDVTNIARFGWAVGPSYLISEQGKNGGISFEQKPIHDSFAAIVSIPSWWTKVKVKIETCWLPKSGSAIAIGDTDEICMGNETIKEKGLAIHLPATADEIGRKLGFVIRRVPYIDGTYIDGRERENLGEFHVGQADATLLIQGKELWRSTAVTLGSQKADIISVLPDMNGIIATFNRIAAPDNLSMAYEHETGGCAVDARLIVWTSEGSTSPMPVRLFINKSEDVGKVNLSRTCRNTVFQDNPNSENQKTESTMLEQNHTSFRTTLYSDQRTTRSKNGEESKLVPDRKPSN